MESAAVPVVIDNGSAFIKAGLAGGETPTVVFPSVVGRHRTTVCFPSMDFKDCYIGEEAFQKSGKLLIKRPIEHGFITNWEDMEKLWHHCYFGSGLEIDPQIHPAFLTEPLVNPVSHREKTTQIIIETFDVPSFYLGNQAVLSLYASGRKTGVVIDSAFNETRAVPIIDGECHALRPFDIGGAAITDFLKKDSDRVSSLYWQQLNEVKEQKCFVAFDFDAETKLFNQSQDKETEYKLPSGEVIALGDKRFRAPEILFRPELIGKECQGVQGLAFNAIMKSNEKERSNLFSNIVLAGGSTMLPGFAERLKKEVSILAPSSMSVNVIDTGNGMFSALIGGSILASLSSFCSRFITKYEYDEVGPTIINTSCSMKNLPSMKED